MPNYHHHRTPFLSSSSSSSTQSFISRLILLLTLLPLSLAALAFVLQWRGGGLPDPVISSITSSSWAPHDSNHHNNEVFPGMETFASLSPKYHSSSSSDCSTLARTASPSLPYYGDWKFGLEANLRPKVRFSHPILGFLVDLVSFYCLLVLGFCWVLRLSVVSVRIFNLFCSGICFWWLCFLLGAAYCFLRSIFGFWVDLILDPALLY